MDKFVDMFKEWYPLITSVIGTFSVIATVTPNRSDNAIVDILSRVVNLFAMNFGNAKNEVK